MEDRQRRNRRQFTAEFKRDAVELVRTSGRPTAEIARELGIYDSTLGNWVKQDRIDRGEREGLTSDLDPVTRYRCVDAQKAAGFAVAAACKAAGVTRSAYYTWTAGAVHRAAERHLEEVRLVAEIRRIHARSGGTYGARGCMPSSGAVAGAPTTSGSSG
jgi:hypothetical protein